MTLGGDGGVTPGTWIGENVAGPAGVALAAPSAVAPSSGGFSLLLMVISAALGKANGVANKP